MSLLRDLRFSLRILARNPGYAFAALAVVALGIGASTSVFSVVRAVLLQPLPYRDPSRLVLFRVNLPGYLHQPALTSEEYFALRDRSDLFESVSVINQSDGNLTSPDEMEAVAAASAGDGFLDTLGVKPLLGRAVSRRDITTWVNAVDISYELWQRRFHGDPGIVGRPIEVNNLPMTVAGVLPRGFRLYLGPNIDWSPQLDVWFPRAAGYETDPFRGRVVIARLAPGVTVGVAQAAVNTLVDRLMAEQPAHYPLGAMRMSVSTIESDVVSDVKPALLALMGAVAFVLLVACANLMNLLLARACARTRELGVRTAVGASRAQLIVQLATESVVLGAIGAGLGLLVAHWGVEGLLQLAPASLPRRESIGIDVPVAAFAIGVSLLCSLIFGLVPAWQATRADVAGLMKQDAASARGAGTMRGVFVASQLALSLILLVGAGLMARAFISMRLAPLGFEPQHTVSMGVALHLRRFNTGSLEEAKASRLAFYRRLLDEVRQLPGVEAAGVGMPAPFGGIVMSQRFSTTADGPERPVEALIALNGFLDTLRVRLVAGRFFTRADDDRPMLVIDQRLADELWPHQSAIGRQIRFNNGLQSLWLEVIGVAAHAQLHSIRDAGLPQMWVTYAAKSYSGLTIVARSANAMALAAAIEATVNRLGAGRPVHDIAALDTLVAAASADTRFALFVLGAFAVLALVLTGVGVYGVVAYATARRTREIALRLALGAGSGRIVRLVVRDSAVWTLGGLAVGAVGARLMARYLETLLFQVKAGDLLTFCVVGLLLAGVSLVATLVPAMHALRTDPMLALRAE